MNHAKNSLSEEAKIFEGFINQSHDWIERFQPSNLELQCIMSVEAKKFAVVTSMDGTLYIIDPIDFKVIQEIPKAHAASIFGMTITSDLSLIITGSADKSIKMWDADTRELLHTIPGAHVAPLHNLQITKKNILVSFAYETTVKFWNLSDKTVIKTLKTNSPVMSSALSADDTLLFIGTQEKNIQVYDFETLELLYLLNDLHDGWTAFIELTYDQKYTISSGSDRSITVCDYRKQKVKTSIPDAHEGMCWIVRATRDNKFIISGCWDFKVRVFDFETGYLIYEYLHKGLIFSISLYGNDQYILSVSTDKTVARMYIDVPEIQKAYTDLHKGFVWGLDVSPDGKWIITGATDNIISVIDAKTLEVVHKFEKAHDSWLRALIFCSDSKHFISASSDKTIRIWDLEHKEMIYKLDKAHENNVYTLACTQDKMKLISGSWDCSVKVWEIQDWVHLELKTHIKDAHEHYVNHVQLTPDDNYFVTSGYDKKIKQWDIKTCTVVHIFSIHSCSVNWTVLTNDSRFLITASDDKTVCIVDFNKRKVLHTFKKAHRLAVKCVALSPDNKLIASVGDDMNLNIYNLSGQNQLYTIHNTHKTLVQLVKFSKDMKYIITSSWDHTVKVFNNPFQDTAMNISCPGFISPISSIGKLLMKRFFNPGSASEQFDVIRQYKKMYIYPYGWNFFHLVAIYFPRTDLLECCIKEKIPFFLDQRGKSPLHYFILRKNHDLAAISYLMENFNNLVYTKDSKIKIIKSLGDSIFAFIKLDTPAVSIFLTECIQNPTA